jgi:catechol 2,3-dioxygenase-like lactoylglutathione lyase family enzyme
VSSPTSPEPGQHSFRLAMMFHPSHRAPDLDVVGEWFERVFGVPSTRLNKVLGIPTIDPQNRMDYSAFTTIRDVIFDTIDPRLYVKEGVQRYPTIEKPHLNGFGWYVEGVADAYRALKAHGYTIVNQRDEPVEGDDPPSADGGGMSMYWLTPEDAGLRYQFLPLFPFPGDPRVAAGWTLPPISPDDPLGVECCSHHTVLTDRPDRARKLFADALGGTVIHEGRNEARGTDSIYVSLADGVYEFAVPDEGTEAYADWKAASPSDTYHSITFKVGDLDKVDEHLKASGVGIRSRSDDFIVTDPETSIGIPFGFTTSLTPGDPRQA